MIDESKAYGIEYVKLTIQTCIEMIAKSIQWDDSKMQTQWELKLSKAKLTLDQLRGAESGHGI